MPSPIIPWICPNCFTHRPKKMGQPPKYPPPCQNCGSQLKTIKLYSIFKAVSKASKTPKKIKNVLSDPLSTQPSTNINELDHKPLNLKEVITDKEYLFLNSYLSGGITIDEAMIQAGYGNYHEKYRYQLSRKIIEKYESQADDHRKIARAMGAGEVTIVEGLLKLARTAKGEMVRLNAWSQLSKILGLTKEQLDGAGGVTIIFEGAGAPGATASLPGAPGAPPLPPSQGEIKVIPASNKPIMITK